MKIKYYLLGIFILILAISNLILPFYVEDFQEFYSRIDFHWPKFQSFIGEGWDVVDVQYRTNCKLINAVSESPETTFYFDIPKKDTYNAKLYLAFEQSGQKVSIYVNDNFIDEYTSILKISNIEDFYLDINKDFTRQGRNTVKIVNHTPGIPIVLEQIKIKNFRKDLLENTYAVYNSSDILSERPPLGRRILQSVIIALLGSLILACYTTLTKNWIKISANRFLRKILIVLGLYTFILSIIQLSFFFSKYSLIIRGGVLQIYFFILLTCFMIAPKELYLKLLHLVPKKFINIVKICVKGIVAFNRWLLRKNNFYKLIIIAFILIICVAFLSRYSCYLKCPHLPYDKLTTGHDSDFYMTYCRWIADDYSGIFSYLAIQGDSSIVILLAFIFKCWGMYPGFYYFIFLTIIMGSLMCFMPYIIISKVSRQVSIGGLIAGYIIAIHPLFIEQTFLVMSDFLGAFFFLLVLLSYYIALKRFNILYLVLFGIICSFMPHIRNVYAVFAPLMLILFFLSTAGLPDFIKRLFKRDLHKKDFTCLCKAFLPLVSFIVTFGIFEFILYKMTKTSYYYCLYGYLIQPFLFPGEASPYLKLHRQGNFLLELIIQVPVYFKYVFFRVRLEVFEWSKLYTRGMVVIFLLYTAMMFKKKRLLTPIWWFTCTYMLIAMFCFAARSGSCTGGQGRLYLPLAILFFLEIALVVDFIDIPAGWLNKIPRVKISSRQITLFKRYLLVILLIYLSMSFKAAATDTAKGVKDNLKKKEYLLWVKDVIPKNAIVLVDARNDPWHMQKLIDMPVVYNIRYAGVYIDKVPYFVEDFLIISEKTQAETPRDALIKFIDEGYELFVIDEYTVSLTRDLYLLPGTTYNICVDEFSLVLYKEYELDPTQAIYQLKRK